MSTPDSPAGKATVSHDRCVGIGMCVMTCASGFDFDDEGLAVFKPEGGATAEELVEAADVCPSSAIEVFRDGIKVY
ncbi:MAG: ferredoxin [Ilumatobacteraceae bacterium]